MLESCSNVDCLNRATEDAYMLAYGIMVHVRVCGSCGETIGAARRDIRIAHVPLLPAPRPQRHLEPVRG